MRIYKICTLLLSFCLFVVYTTTAQLSATGTVYLDENGNGRLDAGEQGITEVAISNGRQVVLTDAKGNYTLEVNEDDGRIFVIKPSEYRYSADELNRPQFYYFHKPKGSPELEFTGVKPTGELPNPINFPLHKGDPIREFSVLLFGDPQPYTRQEVDYFDRDIVSELHEVEGYEFGITLGDIVGDDLDLFQPYSESIAKIGVPWFNVYGNHDMNFDAGADQYADETFEATFGPATYSFNHGDAHFIILDDVIYPQTDGESGYIGGFTEEQLTFIENDLKHVPKDKLVVLAMHIPLFLESYGRTFRVDDRDRLFELLGKFPHTLSLSAHTHMQQFHFFDAEENWPRVEPHVHYNVGTTSGDWWSGVPDDRGIPSTTMRDGTPNGYGMLHIDGNSYRIDYKVANHPEEHRMSIWGPKVVPQDSWHGAQLIVNYFLGNEYTKLFYRVEGADMEWQSIGRVEAQDLFIAALRQKWDTSETLLKGKRPSNPVASTHLWSTWVPNNLPLGEHTLEIKVTDMFGRTFIEEYSYEVVQPHR